MFRLSFILFLFLSGCAFNSYYDIDQAHRRTDIKYVSEYTDHENVIDDLKDYLSPKKDDSQPILFAQSSYGVLTQNQLKHDREPLSKAFYKKITDIDYIDSKIVCVSPHPTIPGCSKDSDGNKEYKILKFEEKWDPETIFHTIFSLGLGYGYTYGIIVEDEDKNRFFIADYEFWGEKVGERPFVFRKEEKYIRSLIVRIIEKAHEEEVRKQKAEKEKLAKERRYEKIVGYKFCAERYPVPFGREFPKNCIFWIPIPVIVSQQAPGGTLVRIPDSLQSFFITKNSVDSSRADGSLIKKGYFVRTGNYQYMSLLGVRTVQKLKRLPDM